MKLDEGDKVVMAKLVSDEDERDARRPAAGTSSTSPIDEVNILAGVGKGVMGIKLDDGDECLGGVLVGGRFDKLVVETENGKTQEFGPGAIKIQNRGGKGAKPGVRNQLRPADPAADRTRELGRSRRQVAEERTRRRQRQLVRVAPSYPPWKRRNRRG